MGCVAFVAFIMAFIFINYKWGVVATPVLQYGMFSSVSHIKDTQTVCIFVVNGSIINNAQISPTNSDLVQGYISNYQSYKSVNEFVYNTIKKYIRYIGLIRFMKYEKYNTIISDSAFTNWFKIKMKRITGYPIEKLAVYKQNFLWINSKITAIDTPTKLIFIGFE